MRAASAPSAASTARAASTDEAAFLARYRPGDFARPSVTVDIVAFSILDGELRVLLVRRGEHPFKGAWALPGGFVRVGDGHKDQGEDLSAAAARELDMRASPYDLRRFGFDPIRIEEPSGRAEYVRCQGEIAARAAPLRLALLSRCERLSAYDGASEGVLPAGKMNGLS